MDKKRERGFKRRKQKMSVDNIGSEGICFYCKHRDYCYGSCWKFGGQIYHRAECGGKTSFYDMVTHKEQTVEHHSFEKMEKEEEK